MYFFPFRLPSPSAPSEFALTTRISSSRLEKGEVILQLGERWKNNFSLATRIRRLEGLHPRNQKSSRSVPRRPEREGSGLGAWLKASQKRVFAGKRGTPVRIKHSTARRQKHVCHLKMRLMLTCLGGRDEGEAWRRQINRPKPAAPSSLWPRPDPECGRMSASFPKIWEDVSMEIAN